MYVYEEDDDIPLFSYDLNTTSTTSAVYNFTLHWSTLLEDGSKAFSNYSVIQHSFNSTSQSRQDVYVVYAMNGMQGETCIDIGANDGVTFSNSYVYVRETVRLVRLASRTLEVANAKGIRTSWSNQQYFERLRLQSHLPCGVH